ncbi:MAG: mycothiol synthase [Bifidobacteriaceae bacterium]|jgi:mycothiol synthase|nr:mycothiol synthase [Bifidobacteriaceae bacterium]
MKAVEYEALHQIVGPLEVVVRHQVLDLVRQVREFDGIEAISEAPLMALTDGDPSVTHILAWKNGELAGYCQRDAEGVSAELAVAPGARRFGLAKAIVHALTVDTPKVRLWAHGDLGAARIVAESVGLRAVRELWEMSSDRAGHQILPSETGTSDSAGTYKVRSFDPRTDRGTWIELNAAAFDTHPEQGKLTVADLDRRMGEGWFDPAGLLFASPVLADGKIGSPLGYVWTKIVDGVGEIYAIGVHPSAQGRRLGTKLLEIGLGHLERQGVAEVRLFVEADNAPAIAAYHRQGFTLTRRDVQYAFDS